VIRRLHEIGVPHLIFTGGEATLHQSLPALVRFASRLGHITGLNTNGRRMADESYVTRVLQAGLNHVQITLASHRRRVHNATVRADAHAETIAGIRNCIAAGAHTITNTTITRDNCDHILDIIEFVRGLGVRTFAMNGMIHAGCGTGNAKAIAEAELEPLLEAIRDRAAQLDMRFLWYTPTEYCRLSPIELGLAPKACNAAEYSICVEPNGDILPCQSYYQAVGNILNDPWDEIWNSPLFVSIRNRRESPRDAGLPQKCSDCEQLQICGGGCPLERAERERTQAAAQTTAAGAMSG
jgi:radical SAM protein with 4Fe4S-binding SPASM domain